MSSPSDPTARSAPTPMERCLDSWHSVIGGRHDDLPALIADDAVLHSPIVFRPQRGKELVLLYLTGAMMTFGGGQAETPVPGASAPGPLGADAPGADAPVPTPFGHPDGRPWDGRFRYVRRVVGTHDAVLEFETTMKGTYVNGVDMIRCDDDGRIVDFKVMIRPLQAVNVVHRAMAAALEALEGR